MLKSKFTKLFLMLGVILMSTICTGCEKGNNNSINKIDDNETKEALINFKFDYQFIIPDSDLSYNYLWKGYDLENKFGPSIPKEDRLFTYLTEYLEKDSQYYLVYLKEDLIEEYEVWLQEYENNFSKDADNYHFTKHDEQHIIDGKYYFCFQKLSNNDTENIAYYTTDRLDNIKYTINDYQLVFCATSKQAVIKENISNQEVINKNITLYKRVELIFDDSNKTLKEYAFTNKEKINQNMVKEMFDYVGEMIEVYPETYKEMEYSSYPILGMKNYFCQKSVRSKVVIENGKKYFLLPRYIISDDETLDLLSDEIDLFFYDDVFREYKEEFKEALIKETTITEDSYLCALYDYEKVINIIKRKE